MADKYVKVSDIEEYCATYSACMQGKGQSVTQAALRRVKEYAIENATDVQPVKRGRWIYNDAILNRIKCSECGFWSDDLQADNFCPSCGADMREHEPIKG